jgi:hypothetical protein
MTLKWFPSPPHEQVTLNWSRTHSQPLAAFPQMNGSRSFEASRRMTKSNQPPPVIPPTNTNW